MLFKAIISAALPGNLSSGSFSRSNTNLSVQPQKMVLGLKFQLQKIDGLYHRCSKKKHADQLCVCPAADLYLHFLIYINSFSHDY